MRNHSRWWLVPILLSALIATTGLAIWNQVDSTQASPFYDAPTNMAESEPGTLLRWEAIDTNDENRLWRMLYTSSDLNGAPIAVSGLIAAPSGPTPENGFDLIAIAHGTTGVARQCAPSIILMDSFGSMDSMYEDYVQPYLDQGYAVVMADYQGLGAAGSPSYLIGKLEGQNVLDSIRAAAQFPELTLSRQVVLQGYSQGGHAAAFALQLAPTYAPEISIDGAVLLAPATDLGGMFSEILAANTMSPKTGLILYVARAWGETYPDASTDQVTSALGQVAISTVINNTCVTLSMLSTTFLAPDKLILPDALETWSDLIAQNTPAPGPWKVPVFVAQGDDDDIVPSAFSDEFVKGLCASGTNVEYRRYANATHSTIPEIADADTEEWIAARFAGQPPTSPACT